MVSLRGRSFGSLQRRISHPASHTSPAAKPVMRAIPAPYPAFPGREYGCIIRRRRRPFNLAAPCTLRAPPVRWRLAAPCPACGMLAFAWARRVFGYGGKHGRLRLNCGRFAPVAQGIEQRFPKPRVGGSNPSRRAPELPIYTRIQAKRVNKRDRSPPVKLPSLGTETASKTPHCVGLGPVGWVDVVIGRRGHPGVS